MKYVHTHTHTHTPISLPYTYIHAVCTQNCSLKFGSWTYDGFKLDVDFYDDVDRIDLNDYVESNEWEVRQLGRSSPP